MDFYRSIAEYYDYIFPYSPPQLEFIISSAGEALSGKLVLDIGCGTGNLTIGLAKHFDHVTGIDLDAEMLELAKDKAGNISNISFEKLNMLDIAENYQANCFDIILSFGNTLVHLKDADEIGGFLKQTKTLLKPDGKLLLQIINYDHILDNRLPGLPTIENEHICFERCYHYSSGKDCIEFRTKLTVKSSNTVIENTVDLYPLRKAELEVLLVDAGYENVLFFGGFRREGLKEGSIPLVVECEDLLETDGAESE